MSVERTPIRVLFDFVSPYSYLAWVQIHAIAARRARAVEAVPVLFAAMLNTYGNKGPAEIPPKRIYLFKDVLRRAHRIGVQLVPPPSHPFNPLIALRVASLPMAEAPRRALVDELFRAAWGVGTGIETPGEVAAAANRAGLDGDRLVAQAGSPEGKAHLRRTTEEAIALGVFGVPTMLDGDELFWGEDSLRDLEAHLDGIDPVSPELLTRWIHTKPSAMRQKNG